MGRPLTGSVRQASPNRWEARVLDKHGTGKNMYRLFKSKDAADVWVTSAVADARQGRSVCEPVAEQHWLDELTEYFMKVGYRPNGRAGPERVRDVKNQLARMVTFLKPCWPSPEDAELDGAQRLMQHLAGDVGIDGKPLTAKEAASVVALAERTQAEYLSTLIRLLDMAVARRILSFNPAVVVRTQAPSAKAVKRRRKADSRPKGPRQGLSLRALRPVLSQLHVLHQLAALLQRVLGLRVSEVFGLRVGDLEDFGDYGVFWVKAQGGRNFLEWTEEDTVRQVRRAERTKTAESYRIQVVPPVLMSAIRIVVTAFHTAPDGTVALENPLIPGIKNLEPSSSTYQLAIDKAGLGELHATSHDLRKDFCVDLSHKTRISGALRRLLVGHRAGTDVHGSVYEGHSSELASYLDAADQIEAMVCNEVDALLTPTTRFPEFHATHPMHGQRHRIRESLHEAGLDGLDLDELNVEQVADQLNRALTTTRRLIAEGTIVGRKVKAADGGSSWVVTQAEVDRFVDRYAGMALVEELADRFEMTYHQMYALLALLDVKGVCDTVTGRVLLDGNCVESVANEMARREELDRVSMRISEAEMVLDRGRTTIKSWVDKGVLELEPSAGQHDCVRVTRSSVEAHKEQLGRGWGNGNVPTRR